ncbi:hypothetical protein ABZV31_35645 [Streptomyces sp. NPDC005202]|uniref:hypothetical protein n=1 Tax=Streptomyces sp. NPDC005202 TaxID=3157021 RepID=UPI0033A0E2F3
MGPDTFRRALKAASREHLKGSITDLFPHLLRHACATHNYEAPADWQERLDELPFLVGELRTLHTNVLPDQHPARDPKPGFDHD